MQNHFANNLAFLRKKSGNTQSDIGLQVGKNGNTIGYWEKQKFEPSMSELEKIAQFFDISIMDLLYSNLSSVHPSKNDKAEKKEENVHLYVHPTVHLIGSENTSNVLGEERASYGMPRFITVDSQGEENVLFVPIKARAGYLAGNADPKFIQKLPAYRLPGLNTGSYRIFEVEGHSMFPTLHESDKAICRADTIQNIKDDRVYVLVTRNDGIICKRLINRHVEGKIICKSDNNHKGEYPAIVLDLVEIMEVWYLTDRWTKQMASPGEIYKRVVDLEAEMILIHQTLKKLNLGSS